MAILENQTQQYYKINFNKCSIRGLKVYVFVEVYKTIDDREKEKSRTSKIAEFGNKFHCKCMFLHKQLLKDVEQLAKTPEEVLIPYNDKIDAIKYPNLREKQELINELNEFCFFYNSSLYMYSDSEIKSFSISKTAQSIIDELGFDKTWINDPIKISNEAEVECGDYLGEKINHELFYNRLKTVMCQDISNC